MDLNGKHVLITGGSRGLGAAMATAFHGAGAKLTLVARGREQLEKVAADVGGRAVVADLAEASQVDGLLARAEEQAGASLDLVVLNAGISPTGAFADLSPEDLRQLWELNVASTADLLQQAGRLMAVRGSGHIVVISSLSAQVALPGMSAYAASKAAVSQLVMGVRSEFRRNGIRLTLVEPNQIRTELYADLREYQPAAKAFDRAVRMGVLRDLTTDEVATAVVDAVRADKQRVVLPKRARLQSLLSKTPQLVADRILRLR